MTLSELINAVCVGILAWSCVRVVWAIVKPLESRLNEVD